MAMCSFYDPATQEVFALGRTRRKIGWSEIVTVARCKLDMLHYAAQLLDLRAPPGNRLEALEGALSGYHSIRVNDQWRIVFRWTVNGPTEVRVCDYH